ncbi:MAG: efflux RND transporter periplasmic adaptor subunit [Nitrospinae bacterium]|nr:efflux RND transporter periplasmic adaptor subunit [Nitrospinota bacterium]
MSDQDNGKRYQKRFIVTLALALVIGVGYFGRHAITGIFISGHGKTPAQQAAQPKERKILYWHDPMLPDFRSDKPGKSPMGMDLVPKYADEESSTEGAVKVSPVFTQTIGVKTAKAIRMDISRDIRATGVVTYDETKLARIQSKVAGWVEKLYVNSTGYPVKRDTIMLELYSPDLVTTQEEYLLALQYRDALKDDAMKGLRDGGERLLSSARRRLELFDAPQHQIEELTRNRKVKKTLHIHSPVAGVVIKKDVTQGMYIEPNMTLYEIADLSTVWVNADIYEYEIPNVKVGQKVEMNLSAFPGRVFEGRIAYIYPFLNPQSRSVQARMVFSNPGQELKPEMYGVVSVMAGGSKNVVAAPSEAVLRTGKRALVFVALGGGKFAPREVATGIESGGFTEIISGVAEGEDVVVSSQFLLDSESKVSEGAAMVGGHNHGPVPAPAGQKDSSMDHTSHGMKEPSAAGAEHKAQKPPAKEPSGAAVDHSAHQGMESHGEMEAPEHAGHEGMDHSPPAPEDDTKKETQPQMEGGMDHSSHDNMGHSGH